ncbi:hypothetical protein HMPREF1536_05125 [Parabacteroides gordonii MS-1 = DSM 23371]|uniref:Uncharacterized protein n=1 Tax=Parabacteroides gordonii MS-1 = DSM 23371 TaxID=1203610 RepID=A0A0F5IPL4_9BACT|nr:hypothetical protein HMPREF1536_05125 [Parabacteroides gordonii MS-1 = DSM 23371]
MIGNIKTIWQIAIFALLAFVEDTIVIILMKKLELNRKSIFSIRIIVYLNCYFQYQSKDYSHVRTSASR